MINLCLRMYSHLKRYLNLNSITNKYNLNNKLYLNTIILYFKKLDELDKILNSFFIKWRFSQWNSISNRLVSTSFPIQFEGNVFTARLDISNSLFVWHG